MRAAIRDSSSAAASENFSRIDHKFNLMYVKRAIVHYFWQRWLLAIIKLGGGARKDAGTIGIQIGL